MKPNKARPVRGFSLVWTICKNDPLGCGHALVMVTFFAARPWWPMGLYHHGDESSTLTCPSAAPAPA